MRREYPERPVTGVGVLIVSEGKILLIKRAFEPSRGRWSIPGGVVELGERVRDAARREVREELGVEVELQDVVGVVDNIVCEGNKIKYHFVLVDFWSKMVNGEIRLSGECLDAAWITEKEVDAYDIPEKTKEVIRKVFEKILSATTP